MSDLIDRQVAIDALKEHRALFCDNTPDSFSKLPYGEKCRVDELDGVIATLVNLPSAQPEITKEDVELYCRRRCLTLITNELYNEMKTRWSAQPEPKKGKWLYDEERCATGIYAICSVCDEVIYQTGDLKYCPNCGARMEVEDE